MLANLTKAHLSVHAKPRPRAEFATWPAGSAAGRLVVVSNRVADLSAKCQSGGLAVALAHALKGSRGLWFGWSGETSEDALGTPPKIGEQGDLVGGAPHYLP